VPSERFLNGKAGLIKTLSPIWSRWGRRTAKPAVAGNG